MYIPKPVFVILAIALLFAVAAAAPSPQSNSTFTITLTFTGANQAAADAKRDAALLDYAKAEGLNIFQADGVTVNASLVAPAVRAHVRSNLRNIIIAHRVRVASAATRASEEASLGNP